MSSQERLNEKARQAMRLIDKLHEYVESFKDLALSDPFEDRGELDTAIEALTRAQDMAEEFVNS